MAVAADEMMRRAVVRECAFDLYGARRHECPPGAEDAGYVKVSFWRKRIHAYVSVTVHQDENVARRRCDGEDRGACIYGAAADRELA